MALTPYETQLVAALLSSVLFGEYSNLKMRIILNSHLTRVLCLRCHADLFHFVDQIQSKADDAPLFNNHPCFACFTYNNGMRPCSETGMILILLSALLLS